MQNDDLNIRKILEKSYDRIQLRREELYSQYYDEKKTEITGLEIINLLFVGTKDEVEASRIGASGIYDKDDEPLPQTISEVKNNIRSWIISWVHSGDLIPLKGDVDRDFDSCVFPPKATFYYIGEKDILKILRDNDLVVEDGLKKLTKAFPNPEISIKPQEPTTPTQPEPERAPPAEGKSDPVDLDVFVKGLTFYFVTPCVFIISPNKRPTPYTLPSMGFAKPDGVTAKDFISILENPLGPYYSLGPSHSRVGAQGKNIADIGTDGEYVPEGMEDEGDKSEGTRVSTGLHIAADDEAQKIEIPEYRAKKARLTEINNKVRHFIEKEFGLDFEKDFKLYQNAPERGNGEYRFNFQTKMFKSVSADRFSGMDKPMILEKLAILFNVGDDENLNEYMALYNHAIDQGISEDEIDRKINFRKNQEK